MKKGLPTRNDGCCFTITTHGERVCATNLIGGGHYPLGGVIYLEHYEDSDTKDHERPCAYDYERAGQDKCGEHGRCQPFPRGGGYFI